MGSDEILQEQLTAFREKTQDQLSKLEELIGANTVQLNRVAELVSANATSIAETRRDIRALGDKLVGVQQAIYFMAHKKLSDSEAEQLRSMLPDPPRRLSSINA